MLMWKSILTSSAVAIAIVVVSCSKTDAPVGPTQSTKPDIPAELQQFAETATRYERLIQAMDPYVTKDAGGAYVFDEAGFGAHHADLPNDDQKVVNELTGGIAVVNAEISKERRGEPTALGSYCNYYWWGKKCCYWGDQAQQIIFGMTVGSGIPGFGLLAGYAGWAQYLVWKYGMFCLNGAWGGPIWLTAS